MDLVQRKLTRQEWNTIEIPVCEHEISVLKMINDGYNNLNISFSLALSLIDYMKMTNLETIHAKLYEPLLKVIILFCLSYTFIISNHTGEENHYFFWR